MACYVVLEPESIKGIYETWASCESGVRGARYRKVNARALAEQLLRGEGRRLEPGTYAFVDGNHMGGIGIVVVRRSPGHACDDFNRHAVVLVRTAHRRKIVAFP